MTRLLPALVATISTLLPACHQPAQLVGPVSPPPEPVPAPVEIVESFPAETSLGFEAIADTQPVWLDMIAGAERRLDISQFYVSTRPDGALEPVLEAIEEAGRRGVEVRVIADAMFADKYPEPLARLARFAAVRRWDVKASLGGVQHAKYFVVDGRELYLGSANFDWRALEHIHELGVRLRIPELARAAQAQFELDWALAGGAPHLPGRRGWSPVTIGADRFQLVSSPPSALLDPDAWSLTHLVEAIDEAELRIAVQLLAYDVRFRDGRSFSVLDRALRRAAARGVAVRLMVSHWQKRHPGAVQALAGVPGIEARFVTIPEHSSGFIPFARTVHAKYMTIDGAVAWIGSSNWDGDYFHHSRNLGLLAVGPTVASTLDRIFHKVWTSPYAERVDPRASYRAPHVGP